MQIQRIYLFFTSFLLGLAVQAQEIIAGEIIIQDTTQVVETQTQYQYGLRAGVDLSQILRSLLDDNYTGFEIEGDFRFKENYFFAAELGTVEFITDELTYNATSSGSYLKLGINYNAYENWTGMDNQIYTGFRVGTATFNQELNEYTIYTTNPFFDPDVRTEAVKYDGLHAVWLEFHLGLQAELFNNLYLGINLQLKRMLTQKEADDFDNLFVPGFNKVTTGSSFGVGYGYTLSYLLPIFKK